MPIYEYLCSACDHRVDLLHGRLDPGPNFCPSCGKEGTMRKVFAPPTIVFKGSGWAKKDRASASTSKPAKSERKSEKPAGTGDGGSGDHSKSDSPASKTAGGDD